MRSRDDLDSLADADEENSELVYRCLELLLATIAAEQADVVRRIDVNGERIATVAGTLGISLSEVSEHRWRGWQALKLRVEEMRLCDK